MMNQVIESTLALMVALLILSISAIVRVRPAPSPAQPRPEHPLAADHPSSESGYGLASQDPGPALWAASGPAGLLPADADQRASLLGRRYEARHVRGRVPAPRPSSPSGPPWGPAPPPNGRPHPNSDRWA
jgi:hypothetical protein